MSLSAPASHNRTIRSIGSRRIVPRQNSFTLYSPLDNGPLDMDVLLSPSPRSPTNATRATSPAKQGRSFRAADGSSITSARFSVVQLEARRCGAASSSASCSSSTACCCSRASVSPVARLRSVRGLSPGAPRAAADSSVGARVKPGSERLFVAGSCSDGQSVMLCADVPSLSLLEGNRLPSSAERVFRGPPGWRNGGGGSPAYIGQEEIHLMRSTAAAGGSAAVGLMKEMEALLSSPAIYNGSFRTQRGASDSARSSSLRARSRGESPLTAPLCESPLSR